ECCRDCCKKCCPKWCSDLCKRFCGKDCGDLCCCTCCCLCCGGCAAIAAFAASVSNPFTMTNILLNDRVDILIAFLGMVFLAKTGSCCKTPAEILEKNYKKDVVYLYQFPGTPTCSSISPFCIKVEAFCRLHGISFERRDTYTARGANDLLPFIELNGERHSDSEIIVRRLTLIFKIKAYPDEQ
ncbi:hypothetical protein PFISCL1PPCAC_12916, partial [Pristionchus fissidentatus]